MSIMHGATHTLNVDASQILNIAWHGQTKPTVWVTVTERTKPIEIEVRPRKQHLEIVMYDVLRLLYVPFSTAK